jgi:hypothetical protein
VHIFTLPERKPAFSASPLSLDGNTGSSPVGNARNWTSRKAIVLALPQTTQFVNDFSEEDSPEEDCTTKEIRGAEVNFLSMPFGAYSSGIPRLSP